jgi:Zn finger protein HypA/HybF involved in hydrogenase expression
MKKAKVEHHAHCMKCKTKKPMHDHSYHKTSNGKHMVKAVCPDCGTKMNLFISGDKVISATKEK